ncbi:prolow-density lipoprotein receptor-related protein 1-like isoform X30 [Oncorhynchus keta]|uniref:prolow-density lipoprotein receptor-related protein 1-like isoform X29 n=1 Tax=Oncorhynchus keta TaxID=8018 RepID=UPI00227C4919|nr:prolow-density lipoprotein receptor-related protein 1-like isoform X29 [Oncorhynchus keta]XP_052380831.1 prolow-density lipoprotein receptor-related protein 1-like isoform X30 [Oncorhynchus keta]
MELLQFTCLLLLISLKCLTGFGQQCGGNQWQCDDGACLPLSWHCDGNGDCMDGSDEMACPCPRGQVACMAGAPGCVNTSAVCDGLRQCSDGSDEFNCPENQGCLQGDWRCRNKICIPKDLYCNGANDCVDNSDEACGRCGPMAVRCPGGACLTEDERCDGKLQCSDGSDEPSTCGRTCSEENGGCSHSCVDQPWGALCSCPKGYRLSANGASCLDVDECALPYGPCMHFCVNTPGSFYCHCRDGFQLQGTTYCYAKGNYTKFLTAKKGTIGFLNLKTLRFESIQSIGYDPLALAFDLSRSSFYWADDQGNIYKAKEQQRRILYHGQYGVRSLVCDWLTGQLYWTNQKTRSIHVGAADGSGFATVLAKNIDPLELVLLPIESLLFWINKGPGDKITLERSGMDGIKQESLVVLTAQAPRSLTLDVTARRLYWMSDFKKSIETVRVDGNGRYSFLEFFKRRPAQSLAVFERWFYWTDQMGLWRSPQDRPNQKTFIQRTTLPVLEAYHEQQQPKAPSACVKSGCQLCMLTLDLPAGFTCTCPDDKLLMADGSCEYPRFAYATSTTLNLFELKGKELIKTKLLTTDDVMESFDIDWRGDWVYWANSTGHVMRWNLNTSQTETVPTLRPACVVAVDQKMRNLYWLSCDEACVGVTNMDQGYPRRLYQSGSEVRDVYLDWQRGRLYLLEAGWILSMRLPGGNPRKVLRVEGHVAGRIVLDLQSNTLLWNTEGDDLKIMSLLKSQTHLVGREWNIPGSIVAAHSPLLVSLFNDVITVWDRRDKRRVHDVPVGPGVVRVIVALDVKEVPPAQPVCTSPSVMCRGSTLCISQTQLCDTFRDCPDGFDEESCITKCPNRGEFRCKDRRKCIKRSLVCDGRAHCHDGSDEIGCPTIAAPTSQTAALKCRMGSRLCKDGRECVLHSHVCDGEVDCKDGSDEQDCGESPVPLTTAYLAPTTTVPDILPAQPVCTSPSVMCRGSTLCISQTQLCDTLRDCPDGFDEESCITKCPNRGEFRCKDRRKCIKRSLVCDGRAHCHDGSDEIGCPTIAAPTSQTAALKCRMGSRLCKDGRECVLHSHVCDGEVDCKDGSDEQDCGESPVPLTTAYLAPTTTVPDILPAQPVCTSPSVMCRGSTLCISQTQLCDTLRDCPDGFDEESCITKCPNRGEFRCKDRRKCIKRSLVCDGRAHCHDGSDEIGCPTIAAPTSQTAALKCRMGSRLCKDGRECVLHSHVCDGEVDCKDGSDEQDCGESPVPLTTAYLAPTTTVPDILPAQPVCTSPSVMCRGSTLCISQTQLCDTLRDCPDGFDEESCITKCPNRGEFRCKDRRKCIKRSLVCDGRAHCHDGSDEIGCPTIAAPTSQTAALKCRMGSRLCKDGRECVLHSHVCDGEVDCKDGSDEQDCGESPVPLTTAYLAPTTTVPDILPAQPVCTSPSVMCRGSTLCISQTQLCDTLRDCPDGFDEESCITKCPNRGEFRCKDRRKCIKRSLVCDGRAHCHDGSDEIGCPTIAAPTSQTAALKCRMGSRLCKDGRECVLHSHVCDGEVDCKDGSDEQDCELLCKAGQFQCAHGKKCIDQQQMCDGKAQCQDRSDEMDCFKPTKSCSHRCDNNSRCIPETFLCDGERDCSDGSDEEDCVAKLCGQQQYHCSNGQCVSEALRCDGHADCGDHSDEVGCAKPPHCPPERRCPNSHECLVEEWLCDGEQDCQDGSDEMNCKVSPVTCGEFQWSCVSKTQCIPATWRCDGQKDCEDYSDEAGCDQLKCSNQLYQCGSGECVDHSLLCDHIINCPDGSDEGHGCSTNNCSSPGTPQCDQHCVSTPYGPRCICAAGFRLQANGLSCVDVDECNEVLPPVCSHICLNTRSSFLCRCHHGYLLEPNGHSCKTQDEAHLLASVQNELLVLGLHSSSLSLLSTSQTPVFCVDYDWRDQRVYWVSLEEESIKWTSINTKETGTLVKGVKSDSIAVDWVGRNLYWLDGLASQILAVRLGTSTVKSQNYIVVLDEDLEQPRSLLLLPHKGLMYWSEVGSDPQIERSGMDGSERKVVLTRGLSRPVSLSVDTLTDRIYWADEKLQCIGSVSLEGHNVRLLQLTEMPSPFSVMVFNDMVYWSDTKRRTIQVSHKNTGKNRKVLLKRPGQPFGIRIMHPLRQSNVSSPCEKLQCSHICLLAPGLSTGPRTGSTGPKAVCRCAAGLLLAGDGLTCSTLVDTTFLLLLSPTAVTQIYLSTIHNGVGLKRLPEHHIWSLPWAHQASGLDLAVQERNLYLADAAQGSVDLLKLSSSGLTPDIRVLNLQDDTVMAMAVDWVTLNLYWSSRKQPDLHVTTTRGQHTAPLLQLGLQGTTSIALHPPSGRLCFTALGQVNVRSLPQVACAFMDGRSQKLLWRKAVMPTSLLFSSKGTRLYWADIGAGVIDSILLDGSGYKQFKADPGLMSFTLAENVLLWSSLDKDVTRIWFSDGFQPKQLWFEVNTNVVALRVYSKTSQKGTNSCSERNGGCSQLCLAYPGGRSCRCGRGYQPVDTKTCSPFPPLQCPEGSRACSDGSRCLPLTKFCNHQTDCLDHSDEIKCWSGVKPQDVSHSKPSPGHAGNTVPPSQDWSGRTTPGGVDVQKLDSESCDAQQCNGHGKCVARGGETTCQCVLGYHGVFCEEGEGPGVSNAPLTLGILSLIGGVLIAAVIIRKSRARAAARGQSTDKETLMTNMDEQTVYAVSFNNDLYDPDQELISSADGTSQHL